MPIHGTERRIRDVLPEVVRQVPIGVGVVRRDRSIAYHNDELARILRIDAEPGSADWRLAPLHRPDGSPQPAGDEPVDRLLRTGRPAVRERVALVRDDGTAADAAVTATPLVEPDGTAMGAVIYVEDLTGTPDDTSLREAFMGVLSHELRTPITSIYGGAQVLLNERIPDDVRSTLLVDIATEAEQLQRLVEDLLVIARVERGIGPPRAEPILLQHLAHEAARAEERRSPGRRIEVHARPDLPAVEADDGATLQILRNLVSNAVKFGPLDEPVVITVSADADVVSVRVLDRGPGFPADAGDDAFRLFYRTPAVAARIPGTGIGLYVARVLVEAQGGRIWWHDRVGGGAEVGFNLAVHAADEELG